MPLEEPSWWYARPDHSLIKYLRPLAAAYGTVVRRRLLAEPHHHAAVPVICIGNFTAGGSGKTPLARTVAGILGDLGRRPVFLTRGYGGAERGPHVVDADMDTSELVGDEALLLAKDYPTVVSRDRAAGAQLIESRDAGDVIVMDDGMQNPALAKDLVIAAIDGGRGIGNGLVIPAGPLRAPLADQLALVDAIVVTGVDDEQVPEAIVDAFGGPVWHARTSPVGDVGWLKSRAALAYAGIGNPERFVRLLDGLGADVRTTRFFADHHPISEAEAANLLALAKADGLQLVTTEKDYVRLLPQSNARRQLKETSRVVQVRAALSVAEGEQLRALLKGVVEEK